MPKSPEEMEATMIANLKEKTGKPLEDWLKIVGKSKLSKHGEIVKMLKSEHEMTHGFANLVAHKHLKSDASEQSGDDLIGGQYAGDKAALKPWYDSIEKIITGLGKDVEIAPKKAYVSFRRSKQFAIVQPSTKTRLDVGINLKGVAAGGKLEPSGSFNAMVSHRVRVESAGDINADLKKWLKQAYEMA